MSDEKGLMDWMVEVGVAVVMYLGYVEMRLRRVSTKRTDDNGALYERITRLENKVCDREEIRTIIAGEMANYVDRQKDIQDKTDKIFDVVSDLRVKVARHIQ